MRIAQVTPLFESIAKILWEERVMARKVIRVRDEFYIRSSSPRVDVRTRVLKQGETFAVFDRFGDIDTFGSGELGLYY